MPVVVPYAFTFAGLNTPTTQLDADFAAFVTYLNARGVALATIGTRPAPGNAGALFISTDENYLLYLDDGAAWQPLGALRDYRAWPGQSTPPPTPAAGSLRLYTRQPAIAGVTPVPALVDAGGQQWTVAQTLSDLNAGGAPAATVTNTTTQTSIWTRTLKGGTLGVDRKLLLYWLFDFLNNTGASNGFTLLFKYGGTQIMSLGLPGLFLTNAARRAVALSILVSASSVTNIVAAGGLGWSAQVAGTGVTGNIADSGTDFAPAIKSYYVGTGAGFSINTLADQTLDLTVGLDVASVNTAMRLFASASLLVS